MKIVKKNCYRLIISCILLSSLSLSCNKENNITGGCAGAPVIHGVMSADRSADLTEGTYNQFVVVKGENFCSVSKLLFNDVEIAVDQIYATPNEITVKIPSGAPDVVNDLITVETAGGKTTADFKVVIPPVGIKTVDNEYAPIGTTMTILGQSFDFGGYTTGRGKIYFGDKEATVTRATIDTLFVTVPENATSGDIIRGVDKQGVEFAYEYPYKDNTNMVVNYDDKPTSVWNRANYVGMDDLPGPIDGNYAHFVELTLRTGFAQDEFVKGKVILPQDVVDNPDDYVLKFEVNTSRPLSTAGIRIFADLPSNKFYAWSPTSTQPFNTRGKWITHTISLLAANGNTSPLAPRPNNEYQIRGIVTTGVSFAIDMSFDNWRIVRKPTTNP